MVTRKSGVLATEEYPLTGFSQLEIGMFDLEVRQGEGYSVVLGMDKNVLDHVQVTQEGETLCGDVHVSSELGGSIERN
jgi:hypothetical protein